ncbi:N-acetylneuraminate synthase [Halobacteriovorax sp. HLS]|uniref:N-acetylneuraminate synthase n=1 Tax=Halobacteriovorax sp. HLS TaxID=2234000 RepID=UPI000FDCDCD2|nr:N-acetylneuraminate synthase [Halobacteriovorax sp. HLS]
MNVQIIAEAGVNHNGSMELAKLLIDKAALAGVDFVKFQSFKSELIVTKNAEKAQYQVDNQSSGSTQYEMLKKLELSFEDQIELRNYAKTCGVEFLSTAFDLESADFLNELGIPFFKIPSGEITNYPYLLKVASFGKPVVISTGMSEMKDIECALKLFLENGITKEKITILHCSTEYPTPMENVNLLAMSEIGIKFGVKVGYSDHTLGVEVSIAATALGAQVIEKHFTLDRSMEGPDHLASLEPDELKSMVDGIRNITKALGSKEKRPSSVELSNRKVARKYLVAKTKIVQGEVFSDENLSTKRSAEGINPMRWKEVVGKVARRDFDEDELIEI